MAWFGTFVRRRATDHARTHDVLSMAEVAGAVILSVFLILFVAALLPWLLAGAVTAAVESLMRQVGFDDFEASTLADWVLVFLVGLLLVALLAAIVVTIAFCFSFLARRAGVSLTPKGLRRTALTVAPPRALPPGRQPSMAADGTRDELYARAQRLDIPGRSRMTKAQLRRALARAGSR
ncbi:MAG: hypothetical protein ACT4PI_08730 [Actinomycetota bacterium]